MKPVSSPQSPECDHLSTEKGELLPCPFCGERTAILEKVYSKHVGTGFYWRAKCEECWATSHGSYHLDEGGAEREWNTRSPPAHQENSPRSAPEPAPKVREALESYINDWSRIIYDATGDQDKVDLAIRLAELNGMFDPAKAALTPVVAREPVQADTEQVRGQGDHLTTEKAGTIPWKDDKRQFPLYELAPDFTLFDRDPQADERLKLYRDIFAEITAKAAPVCDPTSDDPERVRYYRLPVGPLHRAAGKLGFQLFNGEQHLANAVAEIARLKAAPPAGQVIANQNDLRGSQPETVAREPIGWRVRVRQGDATYHLYTEALPFEPWTGSPITVLSEPEPLYTSPPPASAVREATIEECAKVAADCLIQVYPHNSSGLLAHQIDLARADVVKAIRALASNGTADESTKTIG